MAREADIALAALVIGLVALLIATGQLVQQIFSTADGYRRCQASVIGPWSKRTRRVWHWGQFRFETKFTTPEIVLVEWRSLIDRPVQNARQKMPFEYKNKEFFDLNASELPIELRETITPSREGLIDEISGDMVSWTSFLRQLYQLQKGWHQAYQPGLLPANDPKKTVAYGTVVGVVYQERTWDLLPSDIIRPMASSRLSTMIVLALRLGMRWENIDVGDGVLRANGNGHSLLSTMVRGIGIVFQYNFSSETSIDGKVSSWLSPEGAHGLKNLIPRRSIDKLSCGIVPDWGHFDIPDLPLCGENIDENSTLLSATLRALKVDRSTIHYITKHDRLKSMQDDGYSSPIGFPIHDMIAVLTPFLVLKGTSGNRIPYPVRSTVALSAFMFWETRDVLYRRLRDRVNDGNHMDSKIPLLREVFTRLESLVDKYYDDFYCKFEESLGTDTAGDTDSKLTFIEDLREIHDWTTAYFESVESRLKFAHLVSAHITLATDMAREAHLRHMKNENPNHKKFWTATAHGYVDELARLSDPLKEKLEPSPVGNNDDEYFIRESWWILVLRGIVWRLSAQFNSSEAPVPSRLYYDSTPVYVM